MRLYRRRGDRHRRFIGRGVGSRRPTTRSSSAPPRPYLTDCARGLTRCYEGASWDHETPFEAVATWSVCQCNRGDCSYGCCTGHGEHIRTSVDPCTAHRASSPVPRPGCEEQAARRGGAGDLEAPLQSWKDPPCLLEGRQEGPRDLRDAQTRNGAAEPGQGQSRHQPRSPGEKLRTARVERDPSASQCQAL